MVGSVSEARSDASGVQGDAGTQKPLVISTDFVTDDGIWDRQRPVPRLRALPQRGNDRLALR